MSGPEIKEARERFLSLLTRYLRWSERNAFLAEHPDIPGYWEKSDATDRMMQRWGEEQEALLEWSGADCDEWLDLWKEVVESVEGSER